MSPYQTAVAAERRAVAEYAAHVGALNAFLLIRRHGLTVVGTNERCFEDPIWGVLRSNEVARLCRNALVIHYLEVVANAVAKARKDQTL